MIVFYGDPEPGSAARRVAHVVTECSADYRAWLADQPGWVETAIHARPDELMVVEAAGHFIAAGRPPALAALSASSAGVGQSVTLSGLAAGAIVAVDGPQQAMVTAMGATQDLVFTMPGQYRLTVEHWPRLAVTLSLEVTA